MENLSKIIEMRSAPGILIFDLDCRLLYSNDAALDIVAGNAAGGPDILEKAREICGGLKCARDGGLNPGHETHSVLDLGPGGTFSSRAFFMGSHGGDKGPTHIMVLIEKIVSKHHVNFEKAQEDFVLTKRELEVLMLVCEGLANKGISERLYISEYTVKDHIKNIMKKMGVGSRNEIMAALGS